MNLKKQQGEYTLYILMLGLDGLKCKNVKFFKITFSILSAHLCCSLNLFLVLFCFEIWQTSLIFVLLCSRSWCVNKLETWENKN